MVRGAGDLCAEELCSGCWTALTGEEPSSLEIMTGELWSRERRSGLRVDVGGDCGCGGSLRACTWRAAREVLAEERKNEDLQ